jgi:ubiquinone/menaquinone biosynthesis C-methylase UbiE
VVGAQKRNSTLFGRSPRGQAVEKPDYGLDAPGVVRTLALFGLLGLAIGTASLFIPLHWLRLLAANYGFWAGGTLLLTALAMAASSRFGKLRLRDRLLDGLGLAGTERVLDVGCGRGLLLVGAAQRLPNGRAVGLDLWSTIDQSGNAPEATLENARRADVAGRVELHTGDMAKMPFANDSFDAVVSNLAIHNVPTAAGRRSAVAEVARVTTPGGRVALADFQDTRAYAKQLEEAGFEEVRRSAPSPWMFPLVRTVTGRKPRGKT